MKNELPTLNERSQQKLSAVLDKARQYDLLPGRIGDTLVVDAGLKTTGCLSGYERLCEVALSDLGSVTLRPDRTENAPVMRLEVKVDYPLAACLGSHWPYWSLAGDYPETRISGAGQLLNSALSIPGPLKEAKLAKGSNAVLILETDVMPDEKLIDYLASQLDLPTHRLMLVVIPPTSMAGAILEASRMVTHAIRLLKHHDFSPARVVGASGAIAVPPPTPSAMIMARRQKDAVVYGAEVILFIKGDNDSMGILAESIAAPDKDEDHSDEPMRPAEWVIHNVETGSSLAFGRMEHQLMLKSFYA